MIREVVHIDETLCDGCGKCIPTCHEGALQLIDGKARLISDLMCDGLGACLGHCPQEAITIEKREAEPYDETRVMEIMVSKGANTVVAHLKHLKEHQEMAYLKEGVQYLKDHAETLEFDLQQVLSRVHQARVEQEQLACGCPGSEARSFKPRSAMAAGEIRAMAPGMAAGSGIGAGSGFGAGSGNGTGSGIGAGSGNGTGSGSGAGSVIGTGPGGPFDAGGLTMDRPAQGDQQMSELRQWPVQMHLINPGASYFRDSDLVLAADCVAYALGNFHSTWLRGKTLAIACPKLDQQQESYMAKIRALIDEAKINTLTVMMMQVPCCGGLLQMVKSASSTAERKVPVKAVIVGVEGEILKSAWV